MTNTESKRLSPGARGASKHNQNAKPAAKAKSTTTPKPKLTRTAVDANWRSLLNKPELPRANASQPKKTKHSDKYVAIDCEMVGVGPGGAESMLARVSVVDSKGAILLDCYVRPTKPVTDYRTAVSGIRPLDLSDAQTYDVIRSRVVELLRGKILIGHSVKVDLEMLNIDHPKWNIRDTSRYKPFMVLFNYTTPSLKRLVAKLQGKEIQKGEHDSIEDARAAMAIYMQYQHEWEQQLQPLRGKQRKT